MRGLVACGVNDAVVKRLELKVPPSHDWQVLQGGGSGAKCGPGGPSESQEDQVAGTPAQGRGELPAEESGGGIHQRQSGGWLSCWIHYRGLSSSQDC